MTDSCNSPLFFAKWNGFRVLLNLDNYHNSAKTNSYRVESKLQFQSSTSNFSQFSASVYESRDKTPDVEAADDISK